MVDERQLREKVFDELIEKAILTNAAADLLDGKLFFCNPDKHTDCRKTSCYRLGGNCILTKREEFKW